MVLWSTTQSDKITRDRQHRIVEFALARSIEKIPYDQESVAVWDDSVTNVHNAFDRHWVDVNLGVWMFDYFKHDRVYVVDAKSRVLYVMSEGVEVPTNGELPGQATNELVAKLRKSIADGALDDYEAGKTRIPRAVDLALVDERPAILSVMPLVPHSSAVSQERGTEPLTISVRFLDSGFLPDLADAYLLKGVRFSHANDVAPTEQSFPLRNKAGELIGNFVWNPELPGRTILSGVIPVLATGLIAIGAAIAFLLRSLRRTCTELIASETHAKHLAFHDVLTGLANRGYFNDRLESALAEVRNGEGQLALLFLDLDRFKQVNDTLGHAAGDALIRDLAGRLSARIGPGDVIARMGGDEFAIVKRNVTSKAEVSAFCDEIIRTVQQPFEILSNRALVGISIGVAMAPQASTDRSELARKADIALYRAKKCGRRRCEFFTDEMSETLLERQTLEMELREALSSERELELVYQPVYRANGLAISGVEALLRWNHPRLGPVSPLVFVSLAEECGLIDQLGDWVLHQSLRAARIWDLETVSINVSPIQLLRPDFTDRVLRALAETELPPTRLEIEVTESTLLDSSGASGRALKALREAGVSVALDDFGTGYSSLSYLIKLEVDRIKIDRSFVQHLSESSQSIVEAIVTMAHAVDVAVTAEGVETHDQKDFLTRIGCNHLQGYLLSPPLTALHMTELVMSGGKGAKRNSVAAA